MEYQLEERNGGLVVLQGKKAHKVILGWESMQGWYWFAFEVDHVQDSDLGDGKEFLKDKIYFGLVQGFEEELGYFAQSELQQQIDKGFVWPIPKANLSFSGRRH